MRFIAHRANLNGPVPADENKPDLIQEVLAQGYDVEIDVWHIDGAYLLGHDGPEYEVEENFLLQNGLWVHAKNLDALAMLKNKTNCFFHDVDDAVLTSHNVIWVYPGKPLLGGSVCVSPEKVNYDLHEIKLCFAVCTDYVTKYENLLVDR
ncbi:MAG: hypothetical protein V3V05_01440 [Pontiella sp.]